MSYRNMCLAVNGGTLGTGANEADRDGDFYTLSHTLSGQGGSLDITLNFPSRHIEFVRCHYTSAAYGGGDGQAYTTLYLNGTVVKTTSVSGWGSSNVEILDSSENNSGLGWDNITSIRWVASIAGTDVHSANVTLFELQAWAKFGDYACII